MRNQACKHCVVYVMFPAGWGEDQLKNVVLDNNGIQGRF